MRLNTFVVNLEFFLMKTIILPHRIIAHKRSCRKYKNIFEKTSIPPIEKATTILPVIMYERNIVSIVPTILHEIALIILLKGLSLTWVCVSFEVLLFLKKFRIISLNISLYIESEITQLIIALKEKLNEILFLIVLNI